MSGTIYLDHNATSPLRPEAREAMIAAFEAGGNPSSAHAPGRAARNRVEEARERVAALCGACAEDLVFTSGGTEAINLALASAVADGARRLLVSAIEHDAVLDFARASGAEVVELPVGRTGILDLDALKDALGEDGSDALVAVMLANNETGVIQPVAEAAEIAHEAGARIHVDAVQGLGKLHLSMSELGADYLSLSAHKLGGPQGAGALALGEGAPLVRRQHGGGQERGRRSGTENVAAIAGFGAACAAASPDDYAALAPWRDALEQRLKMDAPEIIVLGGGAARTPNTLCFAAPGFASETQVMALDLAGFAVSAGSACSSGKVTKSHVLSAMGLSDDLAGSAIRVSLGWDSKEDDAARFAGAWLTAYQRIKARAA